MSDLLTLVKTADGSNTLYNAAIGEHYHSMHGAVQESRHVFLNEGLLHYMDNRAPSAGISVLEIGFGTGLNFLLTAEYCTENHIGLRYTGVEAYPIEPGLLAKTGYGGYVPAALWDAFLANYPAVFGGPVKLSPYIDLHNAACKLTQFQSAQPFDIVYFDAFASARQPEMWDEQAIGHVVSFLKPGGIFVTYAITGNLKRMLKALGCRVEKAPGAPGKREMLRAVKMQ